jgi:hypothetical protein
MTDRSIKFLVWGLVFVLVDLRIVTFDIIHDLIGYILLYKGIGSLPVTRPLKYAKTSAVILALFSLFEIFGFSNINLNEMNENITLEILMVGVVSIISLFFHLNLLTGLLELVKGSIDQEQYRSLATFRTFYAAFNLIVIFSFPTALVFREMFMMVLICIVVIGLIVEIVYVVKINSFKRFFPTGEGAS